MSIILVGLNHRTAPVEIREQLAFGREGVPTALMFFAQTVPRHRSGDPQHLQSRGRSWSPPRASVPPPPMSSAFSPKRADLPAAEFTPISISSQDEQACRHFFRVASGLDSMVLGEDQIVNQTQAGVHHWPASREPPAAFSTAVPSRLCKSANAAAPRRHRRREAVGFLGRGRRRQVRFGDFGDKQTLVVGAGEAARLVCQHLACSARSDQFVVMSHSLTNARMLAEACHAAAAPFDQFEQQLV